MIKPLAQSAVLFIILLLAPYLALTSEIKMAAHLPSPYVLSVEMLKETDQSRVAERIQQLLTALKLDQSRADADNLTHLLEDRSTDHQGQNLWLLGRALLAAQKIQDQATIHFCVRLLNAGLDTFVKETAVNPRVQWADAYLLTYYAKSALMAEYQTYRLRLQSLPLTKEANVSDRMWVDCMYLLAASYAHTSTFGTENFRAIKARLIEDSQSSATTLSQAISSAVPVTDYRGWFSAIVETSLHRQEGPTKEAQSVHQVLEQTLMDPTESEDDRTLANVTLTDR